MRLFYAASLSLVTSNTSVVIAVDSPLVPSIMDLFLSCCPLCHSMHEVVVDGEIIGKELFKLFLNFFVFHLLPLSDHELGYHLL